MCLLVQQWYDGYVGNTTLFKKIRYEACSIGGISMTTIVKLIKSLCWGDHRLYGGHLLLLVNGHIVKMPSKYLFITIDLCCSQLGLE